MSDVVDSGVAVAVVDVETAVAVVENDTTKKKSKSKRGRGRPKVYTGNTLRHMVAVIRKHGLTGARAILQQEENYVSMPTLSKIAKEAGIELPRGRPKNAA